MKNIILKITLILLIQINLYNEIIGQQIKYKLVYNPTTCLYEAYAVVADGSLIYPNTIPFPSKFSIVVPASVIDAPFNVIQNLNPLGLSWSNSNNIYAPSSSPNFDFHAFTISGGSSGNAYPTIIKGDNLLLFTFKINHTGCNDGVRCYINGSDPNSASAGMNGIDFTQSFKTFPNIDRYAGNISNPVQLPRPVISANYTVNCNNINTVYLNASSTTTLGCGNLTYQWTGSNGIISNQQNIVLNSTLSSENYTVTVTNNNGCSNSSTLLYIQPGTIQVAGNISGLSTACQNQSNVIYELPVISNATAYIWTLPDNTIDTTNTNSITVNFNQNAVSGNISVKGYNICNEGIASNKAVIVNPSPNVYAGADISVCAGDSVTLSAIGGINYQWNNGIFQNIAFIADSTNNYIVQSTNQFNCIDSDTIMVNVNNKILIANILLEGLNENGYLMKNTLNELGEPQWSYNIADKILLEIRNPTFPYEIIESKNADLKVNLEVKTNINCLLNGLYYIVIKHRNHLETWSSSPISFSSDTISYNFTNSISKAFGDNLKVLAIGRYAIMVGDVNHDGVVDISDLVNMDFDLTNGTSGYIINDLNGDGVVDLSDLVTIDENLTNGVVTITP